MKTEDKIREIENLREQLHQRIDYRCNKLIEQIQNGEVISADDSVSETILPLKSMSAFFKGTKVISVIFADGCEEFISTWKEAATMILRDCNSNEIMHERLLDMCGKVSGRNRLILGSDPSQMNVPLIIDDELYFEGKFDTESLLNVLKTRLLDVVGYDYNDILIKYREPEQSLNLNAQQFDSGDDNITEEDNEDNSPVMTM